MSDLRQLIRDILAEELAAMRTHGSPSCETHTVRVQSDADLMDFASDLLVRAQDDVFRRDFQAGLHRFVLQPQRRDLEPERKHTAPPAPYTLVSSIPTSVPELTKTVITERDIGAIPQDRTRIRIGKLSRLTPLASDELKRRSIKIERIPT